MKMAAAAKVEAVAVAFWNMIGAGVFGFLINPPISLFYIQGLNTTAVHAHAALFGVYGFLALGFVLLIAIIPTRPPFNSQNAQVISLSSN